MLYCKNVSQDKGRPVLKICHFLRRELREKRAAQSPGLVPAVLEADSALAHVLAAEAVAVAQRQLPPAGQQHQSAVGGGAGHVEHQPPRVRGRVTDTQQGQVQGLHPANAHREGTAHVE